MRKKEFTSFDVTVVVRELRQMILGSRVNNVYQIGRKTLLLKLHAPNHPTFQLVMEAGKRLHLTAYAVEKPLRPSAFCMSLRSYLRNASLTGVEQHELDRVVTLSFRTDAGISRLILEVFGEGNIILVGENGKILQALTYKQMRDRSIMRGEIFQFPPSSGKNPLKMSLEELHEGLKSSGAVEVVRALTRFSGIGGQYSEEVLLRAGVEKTRSCSELSASDVSSVYNSLQDMLLQATMGTLEPSIVVNGDSSPVDVIPIKLKQYQTEGFQFRNHASFDEALDEFYTRISVVEEATARIEVEKLNSEADRLKRVIGEQETLLVEGKTKAELEKQLGDAVYAHMNELQTLFERLLASRQSGEGLLPTVVQLHSERKQGKMPSALFESLDKNMIMTVNIDDLKFGLNLNRTLFKNANDFYERSKQIKQKMEGAKKAMENSLEQLSNVEAKIRDAEALRLGKPAEALEQLAARKIKPKKWFEKFRWFISSDGFLVVAGKDAVTNEVLIKKYSSRDDVVLHADIVGAPFTVVKTETRKCGEQCLSEAAEFAAAFSRAWREGYGSVDVFSVKPEQLSKGGPSGESVGHGAFVVHGQRNWMRGVTLQVAIGINIVGNDAFQFVGGPISAVKARTEAYVTLAPGDLTIKDLFKPILKALAGKVSKDLREKVLKVSIEDIREYIPYGKGRILKD